MRVLCTALSLALVALLTSAVGIEKASAVTDRVVRDSRVVSVFALGDMLVYARGGTRRERVQRPWMRKLGGRLLVAEGVPDHVRGSAIGRDRTGRVVVTMVDETYRRGWRVRAEWWLYDVARDRARRLRDLPVGRCAPHEVSIWRKRLAYTAGCAQPRSGVFLRVGGHTRRAARGVPLEQLALRGDALAALSRVGDASVYRLLEGDEPCESTIAGSFLPEEWLHFGPWLRPGMVLWWAMPHFSFDDPGALLGARLDGHCGDPGPTGAFELVASVPRSARARTVDGRWLYYADDHGIRRQRLPARAVTDPPPNDDFERAEPLAGNPPISIAPTIGNATTQPGEPIWPERTIWYAFRPVVTEAVAIRGGIELGVFTGTELESLTRFPAESGGGEVRLNAIAGVTYWISLSCSSFECYVPTALSIRVWDAPPPPPPSAATASLL